LQETEAPASVLMQAADEVARQVGGEGFGLSAVRSFALLGRPAAEGDLVVQAGALRLEGRARLLRAEGQMWALAWGLASSQAPEEARTLVRGFPATLEPDEPAFFDPWQGRPDPEEALVLPRGEERLRRHQLEATVDAIEAAAGVRLPRAARAEAVAALADDARRGEPATRAGYRDVARALHEASAKPAEERRALAIAIGRRVLEALEARGRQGYEPALKIALLLQLGVKPGAGDAADGLTRFELEHLLDAAAFVAALGADRLPRDDAATRMPLRAVLADTWRQGSAAAHGSRRTVALWAADLRPAWERASAQERLRLRAGAARLLRGAGPGSPDAGTPPAPEDARALRRLLDEDPLDDPGLLERALAAPAADLERLLALLPFASVGK
jgi:hypothetical protein